MGSRFIAGAIPFPFFMLEGQKGSNVFD